MKKWKQRIFSGLLAAAVALGGMPGAALETRAESQENPGSLQSRLDFSGRPTYLAYNDIIGDKNMFTWTGQGETAEPGQFYDFRETAEGSGIYVLVSTANQERNKAVSLGANGSSVVVAQVDAEDTRQQWQFEKAGEGEEGFYLVKNVASEWYLTTPRSSEADPIDRQYLSVAEKDSSDAQLWKPSIPVNIRIDEEKPEPTVPAERKDHLASGANTGTSDQYLGVAGGSSKPGTALITWTGPEPNQEWKFAETEAGGNVYRIINTSSNLAIAAQDLREGSRLVQLEVSGDDKQLWTFVKTEEEGTYRFRNVGTHLYLTADVKNRGTMILQKNQMDSDLQLWRMANGTPVNAQEKIADYAVKIWVTDGIGVVSSQGAAVLAGEDVTFTLTPREGYKVSHIKFLVNGREQALSEGDNGTWTCTVTNVSEDLTVKAQGDVTTLNGYIYIPEDNYPGRNQCLSPRVVEGFDGTLYATFENGTPSEIIEGEYSFPIYESKDKGETWKRVGEVTNDDRVHPDDYYRIDEYYTGDDNGGAPKSATKVEKGEDGAVRHPWSMQNCPQLFVLPEDQGDLKAGTLICAGVAVPLEEGAETVSDKGYGGLWDSSLDLYYSTDGGRNWTFRSTIAAGGANPRNIMGYDPVWEPFFLYHEGNLICYYSDETDDAHGQKLVYKITKDGGRTWGDSVDIVAVPNQRSRPGMPVVTQLENGKWMLVYETVGMTSPIKSAYKIADDPYNWNPSQAGYNAGESGGLLPGIQNVYGGSPYVYTLGDGRVVAGTGSLSEVFVNTKNDGTGEWKACTTNAPAGYNRSYIQLSTGEFLIAGTEGPGFATQGNKIFVKKVDALSGTEKPDPDPEEPVSNLGIFEIYKAFRDEENVSPSGELVDPEFGTAQVALNSSLSPRMIELKYQENAGDNGKLLATFECNRLPKSDAALVAERQGNGGNIRDDISGFPVYESVDGGITWGGGYREKDARGGNWAPVGYVQNQGAESGVIGMRNCPQIYEMPETIGDLKKGTIICAGNSIQPGTNGAAADVEQSSTTYMDLCISTDLGRTWSHHSTLVGPIDGQCMLLHDTVWEPFFLTHEGRLYAFYSDESIDGTTDQDISYVVYDGEKWSEKHQVIYTRGQRPGMPVVSQLSDGRFMMTFEYAGGRSSGYILSAKNDPTKWLTKDGQYKETVSQDDYIRVNNSGSPYNIVTDTGVVVYNNNALGQFWVNSSKAPDEEGAFWIYYHTGLANAYNRQILPLANGDIMAVGGWNDSSITCVRLNYDMNPDSLSALESKVRYNGQPTYAAYNNSPLFTWTGAGDHAEPNQYYEFQEIKNGIYCLVSTNNGKAVTAKESSAGSGIEFAAKDTEDEKQKWVFEKAGVEGYYRVKNVASGLYMTTPRTAESDAMDLRLTLEEQRETDSQLWKFGIPVNEFTDEGEEKTFRVQVSAGEGGSIQADKTEVKEGGDVTFTIMPEEGFQVKDVVVNGESVGAVTSYTLKNVAGDVTVSAEFEAVPEPPVVKYTVMATAGEGGAISPETAEVDKGASVTFAILADEGFRIKDVVINGVSVGAVSSYTVENVTEDIVASAVFEKVTQPVQEMFDITTDSGKGGRISPASARVKKGETAEFKILPDKGYEIRDVKVDGVSVGKVSTYKFENVVKNHTITAAFKKTAARGTGGQSNDAGKGKSPKTGDTQPILPLVSAMLLAEGAAVYMRKRRKNGEI